VSRQALDVQFSAQGGAIGDEVLARRITVEHLRRARGWLARNARG
jgi:hypothetical protein